MLLDPVTGWCAGVRHCPSAHCNERPQGEISLLVLHNISLPPGQFGTGKVQEFFTSGLNTSEHAYFAGIADMRVSAHFFIERDGQISQFVSCLQRAWHAGVSSFAGRDNCNDFSLGIELKGSYFGQMVANLAAAEREQSPLFSGDEDGDLDRDFDRELSEDDEEEKRKKKRKST